MMKYPALLFSLPLLSLLMVFSSAVEAKTTTAIPAEVTRAFFQAGIPLLRKRAPIIDFSLPLLDGNFLTLSSLKRKVVFLNFWATWCPPCRQEMPSMETLYQRFKDLGLVLLAVDIQEKTNQVSAFIKEFGLTFPVALDSSGSITNKYGIRGIPATFIIDRDGSIILSTVGGRDWSDPAVVSAFEVLLRHDR
jgi:peroxiredoxin